MASRKKLVEPATTDNLGSVLSTVSGPSTAPPPHVTPGASVVAPALVLKVAGTETVARGMPYNAGKAAEYGDASRAPPAGQTVELPSPIVGASTVSEGASSAKVGSGQPPVGRNATIGSLDRVRADGTGTPLTTNQGVPVADNQHSLKIGLRGPTALEDFILREKITHFDHERIPERIVHARGSGAHGYFECTDAATDVTKAAPFSEVGKRTPVFVRFSTVAGERGSADTARDVRGFAVKFYTDEGNWDLVGNNIPVFFIQDAMKFPDLIHAAKPEPNNGIPQAATAHDTFWDFASLMPESAHMLMWTMSDRAIPRSLRMMQGFGVHTFRLVDAAGQSTFCKFHWTPKAGTHSLEWDEAVKISGADADFHRRDLWEAIEAGAYPEWELGLQLFTEADAEAFDFDVLDSTKLIPEELVPLRTVGRLVLDRNPDNFFAETEQVAFCTAHVVPGIDFSNDPLLQGRIHSYLDTQISRLGGPNFHEIPINSPIAPVSNNQRDGLHRQAIHRGRVSYEPNSLGGGCPFQAGAAKGFTSFPEPVAADKVRGKPEKFAEHFGQAAMFFRSQTEVEQLHIIKAFRFELTRVQTPAVRERVLSLLANIDAGLASGVAMGLGLQVPDAMPRATELPIPQYAPSKKLSLTALPGDGGIATRRIAVLVAPGVDAAPLHVLYAELLGQGAVPRYVGLQLGALQPASGGPIHVDISIESAPSVLWDAVVVPSGERALKSLAKAGPALEFVRDAYRHCKPFLVVGNGSMLMDAAGLAATLPSGAADPGIVVADTASVAGSTPAFVAAVAAHRHPERASDPPST